VLWLAGKPEVAMNDQSKVWQRRWRRIQTCTKPANRPVAEAAVAKLYHAIGIATPRFKWMNSPMAVICRISPHTFMARPGFWPPEVVLRRGAPASYAGLSPATVADDRGQAVGLRLRKPVLETLVRISKRSRLLFRDRVTHLIQVALSDYCYHNSGEHHQIWPLWFMGQHDSAPVELSWWRDVARRLPLLSPQTHQLDAWVELCGAGGWGLPFDRICYLCERPVLISLTEHGLLHCDGSPAVVFRDGCAVWALNGVAVPQWLGETAADEINPRRVVQITNAEIRREFIRKVGMDKICDALQARCIDRQGDYELLLLALGSGQLRPYLKMLNPSIGTWHVEGVAPTCRTVAQALAWRNRTNAAPAALT